MTAETFTHYARYVIDTGAVVYCILTVIHAALHVAGHKHTDPSTAKWIIVVVNCIGVAAWFVWRPVL